MARYSLSSERCNS